MSTPPPVRPPYPTEVGDEEWAFVAPYLALVRQDAPQRRYSLREVFNGLRWFVRTGAEWPMLPHDFPRWEAVYQQYRRWLDAGVFAALVHDRRTPLRQDAGRAGQPSAAILDARTLQSTPESGGRAGYDGHKRKQGSKVHAAVDTLGHLLALVVTPASEQERAQVADLAPAVQEITGEHVELADVDQGCRPWSSCQRPSAASCCCPAAGWWSAASPGRRASAGWPTTTSGSPRRWRACISSPSPA